MTDKGKEQKAYEIYQRLIKALKEVSEKAMIIKILTEKNGFSFAREPKIFASHPEIL
jgi:hypothetical protein